MESAPFKVIYAAHTANCTFLLDAEGICRRVVVSPSKRREATRTATRCVGAQYVASLDPGTQGGLVELPRVGAAMLLARVDGKGRVSLVRTGVVSRFETQRVEDPFADSVETSAPDLTATQAKDVRSPPPSDPDYFEASERTQRIQALRTEDTSDDDELDDSDLATAQYGATPPLPSRTGTHVPTLRNPPAVYGDDDDDDDDDDDGDAAYDLHARERVRSMRPDPSYPAPARSEPMPTRSAGELAPTPRMAWRRTR